MKNLLSKPDQVQTGMDELRDVLRIATTADMRTMVLHNEFETERELTVNLLAAAIWKIPYADLASICGISIDAAKAIQELAMKDVATMVVHAKQER